MQKEAAPGGRRRGGKSHQNQEKTCRITSLKIWMDQPKKCEEKSQLTTTQQQASFKSTVTRTKIQLLQKRKKAAATYHYYPHAKNAISLLPCPPQTEKPCLPCTQFYQDPVFREIQKKSAASSVFKKHCCKCPRAFIGFPKKTKKLSFLAYFGPSWTESLCKKEKEAC